MQKSLSIDSSQLIEPQNLRSSCPGWKSPIRSDLRGDVGSHTLGGLMSFDDILVT